MNEKLKRIIAVGGASLMAGSAAVPTHAEGKADSTAVTKHAEEKKDNIMKRILKENPGAMIGLTLGLCTVTVLETLHRRNEKKKLLQHELEQLEKLPRGEEVKNFLDLDLTQDNSDAPLRLIKVKPRNNEIEGTKDKYGRIKVKINPGKEQTTTGSILSRMANQTYTIRGFALTMAIISGGTEVITLSEEHNKEEVEKKLGQNIPADIPVDEETNYQVQNRCFTSEGQLVIKKVEEKLRAAYDKLPTV